MATIDELLHKRKNQLEKTSTTEPTTTPALPSRKKIQRTGPTGPWQGNLPQYQTDVDVNVRSGQQVDVSQTPEPTIDQLPKSEESQRKVGDKSEISQRAETIAPFSPEQAPSDSKTATGTSRKVNESGVRWLKSHLTNGTNSSNLDGLAQPNVDQAATTGPLNSTQIEHKVGTNRTQTEHKVGTEPDTNRTQSRGKQTPLDEHSFKSGHKPDTEPDTKADTNRTQSGHKPDTQQGFSSLVGIQREITIFIYENCKTARAQITEPLVLEHIALSLGIRLGSVKTTLRRLEEKAILRRVGFKNGRGGWSRYELLDSIYRELLQLETEHKLRTNRTQTEHKVGTKPDTEPDTRRSSSSSFVLDTSIKTTTGELELFESDKLHLSPERQQVDCSPLEGIGFTQIHLIQIVRSQTTSPEENRLTPQEVQNSIRAFAFDLRVNGKAAKIKSPPLNFFMGIVRKGMPYAAPENYKAPEDEAWEAYIKSAERIAAMRSEREKKAREISFENWLSDLSLEEKVTLAPEFPEGSGHQRSSLFIHFTNNVWPELRGNILKISSSENQSSG